VSHLSFNCALKSKVPSLSNDENGFMTICFITELGNCPGNFNFRITPVVLLLSLGKCYILWNINAHVYDLLCITVIRGIQKGCFVISDTGPTGGPQIRGLRGLYMEDDMVEANCTSPPSNPAMNITWYMNDKQVSCRKVRQWF
jgi:hypothetical protein